MGVRYPEVLGEDGGRDLLVLGHLGEQLVVGGLVEHHYVVHILLLLALAATHPQPTGVLKIHHALVSFYHGNQTHDTQEHGSQVQGTYMNKEQKPCF